VIVKPGLLSRVRLGGFELDLNSGELRAVGTEGENRVVLREQPFQVLRMLIERGGEIVTREDIKKRLWPNDTIVDFDHSINVAIGILRRALELVGALVQYENYRLCYVRGPEGILVALAEKIG
jgi:eukaryotic-like serine/threonine-protein kinase